MDDKKTEPILEARKANNFRVQQGCVSCIHMIDNSSRDEESYFCGLNAPPFPEKKEDFKGVEELRKFYDDCALWEHQRSVLRETICDKWESKHKDHAQFMSGPTQ